MKIVELIMMTCPHCGKHFDDYEEKAFTVKMKGLKFSVVDGYFSHPFVICDCGGLFPLPIDYSRPQVA